MSFQHKYPLDDRTFVEVSREQIGDTWTSRIMLNLYATDAPESGEGSYTEVARMMLRSLEPIVEQFSNHDFVQHGLKSVNSTIFLFRITTIFLFPSKMFTPPSQALIISILYSAISHACIFPKAQ
jgi:hypothetical protein